jgi:hypothetical protein
VGILLDKKILEQETTILATTLITLWVTTHLHLRGYAGQTTSNMLP